MNENFKINEKFEKELLSLRKATEKNNFVYTPFNCVDNGIYNVQCQIC